jgi:hypothetical protein
MLLLPACGVVEDDIVEWGEGDYWYRSSGCVDPVVQRLCCSFTLNTRRE